MEANGWDEYKKLIVFQLSENTKQIETVVSILGKMREDLAALKVKAAVAGGIAGMIGTGIITAIVRLWR